VSADNRPHLPLPLSLSLATTLHTTLARVTAFCALECSVPVPPPLLCKPQPPVLRPSLLPGRVDFEGSAIFVITPTTTSTPLPRSVPSSSNNDSNSPPRREPRGLPRAGASATRPSRPARTQWPRGQAHSREFTAGKVAGCLQSKGAAG
jgi:hypothetical protein